MIIQHSTFNIQEAAHYLGSSETVIKRETAKGSIPVRYLGAKKLYDESDLDALFESLPFQRIKDGTNSVRR